VRWEDSFLLHEAHPLQREHLFANIQQPFLLDRALGVTAMEDRELHDKFLVVSTFEVEETEFVAMVEGKRAPVFGVMYSPQKSQFSAETIAHVNVDQSMQARHHAQFLANYFVDAARESKNRCADFQEEQRLLVNNSPSVFVEEKVGRSNVPLKMRKGLSPKDLTHTHSLFAFNFSELKF